MLHIKKIRKRFMKSKLRKATSSSLSYCTESSRKFMGGGGREKGQ